MTQPYVIDEMISAKTIAARIEELAGEIRARFSDTDKLIVVGLLRGSFVFIADLVRELDMNVEVDFLEASSCHTLMLFSAASKWLIGHGLKARTQRSI